MSLWQEQNRQMEKLKLIYKSKTKILQTRLQEKFNLLGIDEINTLNTYATAKDKQTCNNLIDTWREQGLLYGYFGNRCNEIYRRRNVTYNKILELYIYYCYIMYEYDTNEAEQETFRHLADYYYKQGQYEAMKEPKDLTDEQFKELMEQPSTNGYTLDEYKGSKALQSTYETHRNAVMQIQRGEMPQVDTKLLEKQENERLKTGLKISGVIDMLLIGINNQAKVNGIIEATKDLPSEERLVRFIAVLDERTTKMCKSLDNQLFSVTGQNTFQRYSDSVGGIATFTCKGLVKGLNLPPINDHFHWCRSTIVYNIDKPRKDWYDKYVEMKTMFNKEL